MQLPGNHLLPLIEPNYSLSVDMLGNVDLVMQVIIMQLKIILSFMILVAIANYG